MSAIDFQVRLPEKPKDLTGYQEHFFLIKDKQEQKIMLHDYTAMYKNPSLYEYVCFEHLEYKAPQVLSSFFIDHVEDAKAVNALNVLEIGAGSGLTAKVLKRLGVGSITGVDIYPEAGEAVARESEGIYKEYFVRDLSNLDQETQSYLDEQTFDALVCCSAMPALPLAAFKPAFNAVSVGAWVVFNVRQDILDDESESGFTALHPWFTDSEVFELRAQHAYCRRLTTDGRAIDDVVMVGIKQGHIA